jgi:hypothetical protein
MGLDIRLPLGLLFSVLGAIMVIYGALSNPAIYHRSLGYNVNVIWGAVLLAFGLLFVSVSRRKLQPPGGESGGEKRPSSPDGQAPAPGQEPGPEQPHTER